MKTLTPPHSPVLSSALRQSHQEPIAIIGMSCRFPQAHTLGEFWDLLRNGKDTITEIPADRWNMSDYYDPDLSASRKTNQRHASMLDNIHDFDPLFFSISPAEAIDMHPSQKLMLELVWQAIENSTLPYNKVQGRKVGVYVGNIWSDFEHLRKHKNAPVTSHSALGQSANIIANRVSFVYGFTGPSLVVDTGCSSSLVALHLACQSLWDGSTEMSFAAGINHILDPDQYVVLSKFGGLSSKGKCSTFDSEADGFVRGEGAGVIMLKKLSQAEKDGDKIYALIRGTAINNNGYNENLPATSVEGQKQMLVDAYTACNIAPNEVHYVETHGTGTRLGDPTEAKALGEFFRQGRNGTRLHVGSVKTNIGHLEAAAGIAGLIKVVLAMQHRQLPPNLNYTTPNPDIHFEDLKLMVQQELGTWPVHNGETFKAGINSFGWGGTNAHTVLEEYRAAYPHRAIPHREARYCLPISAKSTPALRNYVKAYIHSIRNASAETFGQMCVASALLKPAFDHRMIFSAHTKEEMLDTLEEFIENAGETTPHAPLPAGSKVVMVFPGQGSQWPGMGKDLFWNEPVFRKAIEACDKAFAPFTDWSLIDQLHAVPAESRLSEINVIQPALCAVQIALARLWMSWGIMPDAVVGHSMGEVAAAHISGALCLEDAARIICTRSRLMKTVSGKGGAMAVTELSLTEANALVQRYPQLSVAVSNSPKSTVLAGDQGAIDKVIAELESQNLFCRRVKVDVASHSQQMDPLKEDLRTALETIKPVEGNITQYSTVRNQAIAGNALQADYWVDNLRGTVQFAAVVEQLMQHEHTIFIEVSPHPVLQNAVNECAEHFKRTAITVASLYREKPEQESIYKNLAELYTHGYEMHWQRFYGISHAPDVSLPSYPYQRERYEVEDKSAERESRAGNTRFPLLGNALELAGADNTHFWETQISLGAFPYLQDHQASKVPVLPAAAYVEMVLEAADVLYRKGIPVITRLRFIRSVTLSHDETVTVQLKVKQEDKTCTFQFFIRAVQAEGKATWELLADGALKIRRECHLPLLMEAPASGSILSGQDYYESLKFLDLHYGPYFRGLTTLSKSQASPAEVRFRLSPDARIHQASHHYKIHPALLDTCFQSIFYALLDEDHGANSYTTCLTDIGEIYAINAVDATGNLQGVARLQAVKKDEQRGFINLEGDVTLYQGNVPVLHIKALKAKVINTNLLEQRREKLKNWLYKVKWIKSAAASAITTMPPASGAWVVMGDPYGVSEILTEKMQQCGMECVHVAPGTAFAKVKHNRYTIAYGVEGDYGKLMAELFSSGNDGRKRKIAGILHAASMSYTWQDPWLTADVVEAHQVYGSISFMYLHQQLAALRLTEIPRLIILTNGIHPVSADEAIAQPVHSPLWGMAKVMFNELTQYQCKYFDLSANPSGEELDQVVSEVQAPDPLEHEMAFRLHDRYVPRLQAHADESDLRTKRRQFAADGTYLVTGFQGLGFAFIEWMVRQGARHFALVSASGDTFTEISERVAALTVQGCRFNMFSADAGNFQELKSTIEQIESSMPELKGVVHAAGVIETRSLTDLNSNELLRILNPKIKGAWNLHLLTQHRSLDCFIMFSSASTLIGLSGQGSYVAANAFLDTLAHSRRRMGLPGMSVNWGVMKDVSSLASKAELERYAVTDGIEAVSMQEAIEVFNAIYDSGHTQIGIVKWHAESLANHYKPLANTLYFKGLLAQPEAARAGGALPDNSFIEVYGSCASSAERVSALELLVMQHLARVVKMPVNKIKPAMLFKSLGLDSLMGVQLRNMLEKSIDHKLSVALFWAHPSIHEYASQLNRMLAEKMLITELENTTLKAGAASNGAARWFTVARPNPLATHRVFCFHDAGGSSALYHAWHNLQGDTTEVVAIELPGRGKRMEEAPYTNTAALLNDLLPCLAGMLDKPFAFAGHSLGGLLAFEVTRALRAQGLPQPQKLIVSSVPWLATYNCLELDYQMPESRLVQIFPHLDKQHVPDDDLRTTLVTLLRADLRLLNSYHYRQEAPLAIPILALHGEDDTRIPEGPTREWKAETTAVFSFYSRPGGHRFIENDAPFIMELVKEEIEKDVVTVNFNRTYRRGVS